MLQLEVVDMELLRIITVVSILGRLESSVIDYVRMNNSQLPNILGHTE